MPPSMARGRAIHVCTSEQTRIYGRALLSAEFDRMEIRGNWEKRRNRMNPAVAVFALQATHVSQTTSCAARRHLSNHQLGARPLWNNHATRRVRHFLFDNGREGL